MEQNIDPLTVRHAITAMVRPEIHRKNLPPDQFLDTWG